MQVSEHSFALEKDEELCGVRQVSHDMTRAMQQRRLAGVSFVVQRRATCEAFAILERRSPFYGVQGGYGTVETSSPLLPSSPRRAPALDICSGTAHTRWSRGITTSKRLTLITKLRNSQGAVFPSATTGNL